MQVYECTESIGAMHLYPALPQRNRGVSNGDMFVVGYSNGNNLHKLYLIFSLGELEAIHEFELWLSDFVISSHCRS